MSLLFLVLLLSAAATLAQDEAGKSGKKATTVDEAMRLFTMKAELRRKLIGRGYKMSDCVLRENDGSTTRGQHEVIFMCTNEILRITSDEEGNIDNIERTAKKLDAGPHLQWVYACDGLPKQALHLGLGLSFDKLKEIHLFRRNDGQLAFNATCSKSAEYWVLAGKMSDFSWGSKTEIQKAKELLKNDAVVLCRSKAGIGFFKEDLNACEVEGAAGMLGADRDWHDFQVLFAAEDPVSLQVSEFVSKEDSLRQTAEIMIAEGRLHDARMALEMLKSEEYFDYLWDEKRPSSTNPRPSSTSHHAVIGPIHFQEAPPSAACPADDTDLQKLRQQLATLVVAKRGLDQLSNKSAEQQQSYDLIKEKLNCAGLAYHHFLDQVFAEGNPLGIDVSKHYPIITLQSLQKLFSELEPQTAILYTLVSAEKYYIILVVPEVILVRESALPASQIKDKVELFRRALQNPGIDPQPLAKELYAMIFEPVAADLEQMGAKTLMWSLDQQLRYLPIPALHDGRGYLVRKYRNVVFTPTSYVSLLQKPLDKEQGLGFGVSAGSTPLPGVKEELQGIFRPQHEAAPTERRPLVGQVFLDKEFSDKSLTDALDQGRNEGFKAIHIASHFILRPGSKRNSYLELGGNNKLTVEELMARFNFFANVELLTLSACSTAIGGVNSGTEIEGFGVLAQDLGAHAVLASLWDVSDSSTSKLMQNVYRIWRAEPGTSKAESLRKAQLLLLRGEPNDKSDAAKADPTQRATLALRNDAKLDLTRYQFDPQKPFAHPYYWAPFILIGNWK
jgi:CHAT domain-containing protein